MNRTSLIDRYRLERLKSHRPFKGTIELTYRCNERCRHCYLEKFEDDQTRILTLLQWKKILHELKSGGVLFLDLIGGEPMLHPHFWEILEYGVELGFAMGMITNGLLINERSAKRLKETGINQVTLSLYSLEPQIHDTMTTLPGSHQRTTKAMGLLKKNGISFSLNCLLTRTNIAGFFELADWCESIGVRLAPDPFVTPKMNNDPAPTLLRATKEQLYAYYREYARRYGQTTPVAHRPEDYVCGVGKLKCAVNPYGELLTCLEVRESLGILHQESFDKLWFKNPKARWWRELKNKDVKGLSDLSRSACDHCPGSSAQELGDPLALTPYSKELSQIKMAFHEGNLA